MSISRAELQEAILEALRSHDIDLDRRPNASLKLQEETNELIQKLSQSIISNFDKSNSNTNNLMDQIKSGFDKSNKDYSKFFDSPKSGNNSAEEMKKGLSDLSKSIDRNSKTTAEFITRAISTAVQITNETNQKVYDNIKSLNNSGIGIDWNSYLSGIRDSVISVEDLSNAARQVSQSFAVLNKTTGNAIKSYSQASTLLGDYAYRAGDILIDNSQIAKSLNSYLEIQRMSTNLDRMNQKELNEGFQRYVKSADDLSKQWGIERDKLLEQTKPEFDVNSGLLAMGFDPDKITNFTQTMSLMREQDVGDFAQMISDKAKQGLAPGAELANLGAITGNDLISRAATGNGQDMNELIQAYQNGTISNWARNWVNENREQLAYFQTNPELAKYANIMLKLANTAQSYNATPKGTDQASKEIQRSEQNLQRIENSKLNLLASSAESVTTQFKALNTALGALRSTLSALAGFKTDVYNGSWFDSIMGKITGLGRFAVGMLSLFSDLYNTMRLFRAFNPRLTDVLRQVLRAFRRGASNFIRGAEAVLRSAGPMGAVGAGATGLYGAWKIGEASGKYLPTQLQKWGMGEKAAKATSVRAGALGGAASGALGGAAAGAMIAGPVGAAVGAVVGGIGGAVLGGVKSYKEAYKTDTATNNNTNTNNTAYNVPQTDNQLLSNYQDKNSVENLLLDIREALYSQNYQLRNLNDSNETLIALQGR